MALALAGASTRRPAVAAACALPYAREQLGRRGPHPRGRMRASMELPGRIAIDLTEMAALALGSARHGTLFL
jgi:hypothetical protein